MVKVVRVNDPAVAEHDPHLGLEHRHVEEAGDPVELRVPEVPRQARFRDLFFLEEGLHDERHVRRADIGVADPRLTRHLDIHQGLQIAWADAPHPDNPAIDLVFL